MAEHDMSVVNLSIAIFQQAADPVGAQYAASPPTSPFHWALALEDLHADSSHYSPSPSMKSVDYGGNSGSSSSDEDTDMPFAPSPAFQIPSPSSSSSSSPSPSPPPVHSSGHAPLGTAPVNLYHILNTKGSRWETSCQMGLRLGTVPSYVGSVDVARIRGIDMKDLDEFLAQFTAENPRPFGKWNAAIWAMNCLEDLHLSELIELPTLDQDALYRRIMARINVISTQKQKKRSGHLSPLHIAL